MWALLSLIMHGVISWGRGEEAYCSCRRRIPRDWLKKTVDEIKEQQRRDEVDCLVCTILGHPQCLDRKDEKNN